MSILLKARLLIVDDEMPITKLLQRVLQNDGHVCETALSVSEAKEKLKEKPFDLIITDLKMPNESGLDLLRFSAKYYPEIGRIMMTGFNTMETAHEILELGVYGYLIKPLNRDMILITVQNALQHRLLENQMQACLAKAQKEVFDKHNTLETILNNIDVGVTVIDLDLRILDQNKTMKLMFPKIEWEKPNHCFEIMGHTPTNQVCSDCPMQKAFDTKLPTSYDRLIMTEHGHKEFRISALPIVGDGGNINKGLLLFHDVSDIMENQKIASESNKLAAVGQLAAGIAHEINTPTQFLGDNINFLQDSFEDLEKLFSINKEIQGINCSDRGITQEICIRLQKEAEQADLDYLAEEIPAAINQSKDGVERIADIVKAIKYFTHPGEQEKTASNINELIKSTLTVCRNEWKYVAEIQLSLDEYLPMVECLQSEISQVLLILIVNSAHSIEEDMVNENNSRGVIHVSTKKHNSQHVQIVISDTGKGIPSEIQDKIFQAFFTTKKRGKGTGQGLFMANNIITEKHDGNLSFTSKVNKGTEFSIILPIHST